MEEWLYNLIGYALYVVIGFLSAIFIYFILKRSVLGRFWAAFIMGIIGSLFKLYAYMVLQYRCSRGKEKIEINRMVINNKNKWKKLDE